MFKCIIERLCVLQGKEHLSLVIVSPNTNKYIEIYPLHWRHNYYERRWYVMHFIPKLSSLSLRKPLTKWKHISSHTMAGMLLEFRIFESIFPFSISLWLQTSPTQNGIFIGNWPNIVTLGLPYTELTKLNIIWCMRVIDQNVYVYARACVWMCV